MSDGCWRERRIETGLLPWSAGCCKTNLNKTPRRNAEAGRFFPLFWGGLVNFALPCRQSNPHNSLACNFLAIKKTKSMQVEEGRCFRGILGFSQALNLTQNLRQNNYYLGRKSHQIPIPIPFFGCFPQRKDDTQSLSGTNLVPTVSVGSISRTRWN